MSNIIKTPISDRSNKKSGITREDILSNLGADSFPSIYVDDDTNLSIGNGTIKYGDTKVYLLGKTLIQVVKELRDIGANIFLTSPKVAGYPAIMLGDFQSESYLTIDIESSPIRLSEYHSELSKNLVTLDEDNITRTIISITDGEDKYSTNKLDLKYYSVEDDLLYLNDVQASPKCLAKYTINKYFLYSTKEHLFAGLDIIDRYNKNKIISSEIEELIRVMNSNGTVANRIERFTDQILPVEPGYHFISKYSYDATPPSILEFNLNYSANVVPILTNNFSISYNYERDPVITHNFYLMTIDNGLVDHLSSHSLNYSYDSGITLEGQVYALSYTNNLPNSVTGQFALDYQLELDDGEGE